MPCAVESQPEVGQSHEMDEKRGVPRPGLRSPWTLGKSREDPLCIFRIPDNEGLSLTWVTGTKPQIGHPLSYPGCHQKPGCGLGNLHVGEVRVVRSLGAITRNRLGWERAGGFGERPLWRVSKVPSPRRANLDAHSVFQGFGECIRSSGPFLAQAAFIQAKQFIGGESHLGNAPRVSPETVTYAAGTTCWA